MLKKGFPTAKLLAKILFLQFYIFIDVYEQKIYG